MQIRPEQSSPLRRLTLAILISLGATAAWGQSSEKYSSVEGGSGKTIQLNYHASVGDKCRTAPLPEIKLIEAPKNGTLTVRRASIITNKVADCPGLRLPAQVAFYTSKPNFVGQDHLIYEVTAYTGTIQKFDITITVKDGAPSKQPI